MNLKKKLTAAALCAAISVFTMGNAAAFEFPEPDWGQLLKEKEAMVSNSELDLYVEGAVESAPYFGARLEPRGGAYIGMVAENSTDFQPLGSYLTYIDDMNQNDIYYPANKMIENGNSAVMVGWTINNIGTVDFDKMRSVLDTLNSYNRPMFIRFANEMNVSSLGDDPEQYKAVFRTAANLIHEYPNFAVVWSPNDLGALDRPFDYFYPGDEYVDWVGVSCYSIKYFMGNQNTTREDSIYFMSGDYAWATNRVKPIIDFMTKNNINKPLMISEGGVPTNNRYGENLEGWSSPRFRNMLWYTVMRYPQIKMVNYFNKHMENEAERYDISDYPYAANIFREAANSGAYITGIESGARFSFQRADSAPVLYNQGQTLKLYSFAYIPNKQDVTVNYTLDGNWYHSSSQIPYTCNLDLSGISDGGHTIAISTEGVSKEYSFYKHGSTVSFINDSAPQTEQAVKVTLDGTLVEFEGQQPILRTDTTLVPMRKIFESLGAEVDWDNDTQTATAHKGSVTIDIPIGSSEIYVNKKARPVGAPAELLGEKTMVPVRAVSEALGCIVDWNNDTMTVIITSGK